VNNCTSDTDGTSLAARIPVGVPIIVTRVQKSKNILEICYIIETTASSETSIKKYGTLQLTFTPECDDYKKILKFVDNIIRREKQGQPMPYLITCNSAWVPAEIVPIALPPNICSVISNVIPQEITKYVSQPQLPAGTEMIITGMRCYESNPAIPLVYAMLTAADPVAFPAGSVIGRDIMPQTVVMPVEVCAAIVVPGETTINTQFYRTHPFLWAALYAVIAGAERKYIKDVRDIKNHLKKKTDRAGIFPLQIYIDEFNPDKARVNEVGVYVPDIDIIPGWIKKITTLVFEYMYV
jgi:hypothetical protein